MGKTHEFKPFGQMRRANGSGAGNLLVPGGPTIQPADAVDRFGRLVVDQDLVLVTTPEPIVWQVVGKPQLVKNPASPTGVTVLVQLAATMPVHVLPGQPAPMLLKIADAIEITPAVPADGPVPDDVGPANETPPEAT